MLPPSSPSTPPPKVWIPSQLHASIAKLLKAFLSSPVHEADPSGAAVPRCLSWLRWNLPASFSTFFSFCCVTAEKEKTGIAQQTSRTGSPYGSPRNESLAHTLWSHKQLQLLSNSVQIYQIFRVCQQIHLTLKKKTCLWKVQKSMFEKPNELKVGSGMPINNWAGCQTLFIHQWSTVHFHGEGFNPNGSKFPDAP